jgi:hypothetical protein
MSEYELNDVIANYFDDENNMRQISEKLNLKEEKVTKQMLDDNKECIICLCAYDVDNDIISLNCKHTYHSNCLKIWLSMRNKICPTCKRNI